MRQWMQPWIPRHNSPAVRPRSNRSHQPSPYRIFQNVKTCLSERVFLALLFPQNVVMSLVLPTSAHTQSRFQLTPQELHRIELITLAPQSHPDQVQMVWHQTIYRAPNRIARWRVEHQLPEDLVELRCEPALSAIL